MPRASRPEEARGQALRGFGNRTLLRETCRERWAFLSLDEIAQDLRQAARFLRKSPVFTLIAISSLALGIGANTVIFSGVEHVLLRSLPYPQPEKLLAVWSRSALRGNEPMHVSAADFYDWRSQCSSFDSLSAYSSWPMNLTNVDEPRRLETQLVSATLFSTLGVNAQLGRTFVSDEDQEQSAPVVVLSHHLWQALGGSPAIIGQALTLNGGQATVIGVMPADFAFPSRETDAWVPLSLSASNRANREGRWLRVIGRLNQNASARDARAEMETIAGRLAAAYPASNTGWRTILTPLQEQVVGKSRPLLLTLQAGGLLLLLITCANLTNLLLANGAARAREIGLRTALGASRPRIVRQLLVESLVLASLGGGAGIALAMEGVALVRRFGDGLIPRAAEIEWSSRCRYFRSGRYFPHDAGVWLGARCRSIASGFAIAHWLRGARNGAACRAPARLAGRDREWD